MYECILVKILSALVNSAQCILYNKHLLRAHSRAHPGGGEDVTGLEVRDQPEDVEELTGQEEPARPEPEPEPDDAAVGAASDAEIRAKFAS